MCVCSIKIGKEKLTIVDVGRVRCRRKGGNLEKITVEVVLMHMAEYSTRLRATGHNFECTVCVDKRRGISDDARFNEVIVTETLKKK